MISKVQSRCSNSHTKGRTILGCGCFNNPITNKLTITYNCSETDILYLCEGCCNDIKADAIRHGYTAIAVKSK
jgi:hypothetical protein